MSAILAVVVGVAYSSAPTGVGCASSGGCSFVGTAADDVANLVQVHSSRVVLDGGVRQARLLSDRPHAVTYLTNADFRTGTYVITRPGKYILKEDIVFAPETPKMFPPKDSAEYTFERGFFLGFFAAIAIEASDVHLDLAGHSLSTSYEFLMRHTNKGLVAVRLECLDDLHVNHLSISDVLNKGGRAPDMHRCSVLPEPYHGSDAFGIRRSGLEADARACSLQADVQGIVSEHGRAVGMELAVGDAAIAADDVGKVSVKDLTAAARTDAVYFIVHEGYATASTVEATTSSLEAAACGSCA